VSAERGVWRHRVVPSYGRRLAGVEGLRAAAAFSIVLFHVWLDASPDRDTVDIGYVTRFLPDLAFGVTLFFTLSGFLLYRPFAAALMRAEPRPDIRAYLRNRALRILPAYWFILVVSAVLLRTVLVRNVDGDLVPGGITSPLALLKHLLLLQHYDPGTVATGIGPSWSLAVEVVFYLVLPLLAVGAFVVGARCRSRRGRRAAALVPPLALLALGLAGKITAALAFGENTDALSASWHTVFVRSFACQADLFSFGMIVAVLRVDAEDGVLTFGRYARIAAAGAAVAAYAVTARLTGWDQLTESPFNTLVAGGCALLVALVVLPTSSNTVPAVAKPLEWSPLALAGLVSYGVFLWHEPVIFWLRGHHATFGGQAGLLANIAIAGGIVLAVSVLTYRAVELPALRRKARSRPVAPARTAAASLDTSSAAP
jgi:peptidoglycan/LPS O-acetylase OafA/YrhL